MRPFREASTAPPESLLDSYRSINALVDTVNGLFRTEVIRRRGPWRYVEEVTSA
jgi:hypothetical protein